MAKLFIGIALAIMLATAALGFLAKGNIDKLQSTLKETKGSRDAAESKAKTAQAEAKKAEEERDTATAKAEETATKLTAAEGKASGLETQVAEAKLLADAKAQEVETLTKKIADMGTPTTTTGVEDPRIAELSAQLQNAQAAAAEAKQVSESLSQRMKDNEVKLAAAEQKERQRLQISGRAGLQGRILAVNPGWNFVVLSVGDKQGVVVNAPLLVVRGNEPIARLRITSVEPSTSIADVIPGSVRRGASVQAGDTVIFEGRSSATQAPAPTESANAPALPQ